jgi:hypothetical protein
MTSYPDPGSGVHDARAPDAVAVADYLRLLWPCDPFDPIGGHINVWTLEGRRSHWFKSSDIDKAAAEIARLARTKNVYVGTALIDLEARKKQEAIENRGIVDLKAIRGTSATAHALFGLHADIDIGGPIHGPAHKNSNLPPSLEDALTLIDEVVPFRPTVIVNSVHGLYPLWLFNEPWLLETESDREEAADLLYRFQKTLQAKAGARGWEVDGTADLARVLRPVGAINRKLDPDVVSVLELNADRRYQTDDFDPYLIDTEWQRIIAGPVSLPSDLEEVDIDLLPIAPWHRKLIRTGNEWDEEKHAWHYGSRSQAVWRVVMVLVEAGVDDATIASILLDDRYKISENPLEKGRRARSFVAREIGKARKVHEDAPRIRPSKELKIEGVSEGPTAEGEYFSPSSANENTEAPGHDASAPHSRAASEPLESLQQLLDGLSLRHVIPKIDAGCQDLKVIAKQAWAALEAANREQPFLFRRGGILVWVQRDDEGRPILTEMTALHVRHILAYVAEFYVVKTVKTMDPSGTQVAVRVERPAHPPVPLCNDILVTPEPNVPVVTRLSESPVFAPDGTLKTTSGYDPGSRTYLAIPKGLVVPLVPDVPSQEDVNRAVSLIDELLADFPFASQADRTNVIGLGAEQFVRSMIDGPLPLHSVEAPTPGSGKGLLVDAILRPSCGRSVGAIAQARDDDEWRKRLTSSLMQGYPAIQIDNANKPIESGALSMAITTVTPWSDRILGQSKMVSVPVRCSWIVTANNPTYSTEMARRTVRTRIDPKVDRPQDREGWRHPELLSWVDDNRGELIWAFCVLVRSWIAAGKPRFPRRALGSFERWSHVIGGILEHAEIEGFLANQADFYEIADAETAVWRAFVAAWWDKFQDREVGTKELFPLAVETDGLDLGSGQERSQQVRFGKLLGAQRDRVIAGYRVTPSRIAHKVQQWRLLPTTPGGLGDVGVGFDPQPHTYAQENLLDPDAETPPDIPQPPRNDDQTVCEDCGVNEVDLPGLSCDECMAVAR